MITVDKEVLKVKSEPTVLTKDIIWRIEQNEYIVRNVPYVELDADGAEFLDLDVSITVTALRDLMVGNAIPNDVRYEDFANIEF